MLPQEALEQLKVFLNLVKQTPQLLHTPELAFFKEFIESFGGVIPTASCNRETSKPPEPEEKKPVPPEEVNESSDEESDVELDNTGVIENPDPEEEIEDVSSLIDQEVGEDDIDKANEKKIEAICQYNEGNYEKAAELFGEAVKLNPSMSLLYVKRGQCYLQLSKPNACIRDCTRALSINPDNAAAYKFRGRAHRLLGHWLDAVKDLRNACRIDFDEQADEWLKEVTPNAKKLEDHQRKYERKRTEREIKEKKERLRKAREEQAKAEAANKSKPDFGAGFGGLGGMGGLGGLGGMGGMGGMGEGTGDYKIPNEFMDIFTDPEIQKCFEDPEVFAAFTDISKDPSNMSKYAGNPKIMALITKLTSKLGGGKGFPGGGFPGAGGFPGFGGGANPPPSGPNISDDIGLD
ncbi:hsc70-interacting protein-like [Planococcus citri]|uniref:hsc70-interacting protein-like n=1 Tax=Planococcus citri TaxID=170843 RepID=UPI0031FA021C